RVVPIRWSCKIEKGQEYRWTVNKCRTTVIYDLDLLSFKDDHVSKLAKAINPTVFDHQQTGFRHIHNKTKIGNTLCSTPDVEFFVFVPYTNMDTSTFYTRSDFSQYLWRQGQPLLKKHRMTGLFRR